MSGLAFLIYCETRAFTVSPWKSWSLLVALMAFRMLSAIAHEVVVVQNDD